MNVRSLFSFLFTFLVISIVGVGLYSFFKDMDGPEVQLVPASDRVSPQRELALKLDDPSGIRSVSVQVRKNNQSQTVAEHHFEQARTHEEFSFSLKNASLRDGAFDLEIKAVDASLAGFGRGNTRTISLPMRLDSQAPRVSMKQAPPHVRRGGCATVLYSVNKEVERTGVVLGEHFFPSYKLADGNYLCFFAYPLHMTAKDYTPELLVEDSAGNMSQSRLAHVPVAINYRQDSIAISDNFLLAKMPELAHLAPGTNTSLEQYLYINSKVRAENVKALYELRKKSSPAILWSGPFIHLPRAAQRARFGDFRTYTYQGQRVDEQTHMGLDLASLTHADVPAANDGKVVFADFMGIHGNIVVLDHGMGLMSFYSHLSNIAVQLDDLLKKGQILGQTGTSGMAFGDHLHFGMLMHGFEVQPLEWLDPKWITNNVTNRMKTGQ